MQAQVARIGEPLKIRNRDVSFSFWPTGIGTRRDYLQSRLFVSDPWRTIRHYARGRTGSSHRDEVEALILQGEDLYRAAGAAAISASRPLLLYYAFLQVAKAYSIVQGTLAPSIPVQHGLSETLAAGGTEFQDSTLQYFPRVGGPRKINAFAAFVEALTGSPLMTGSINVPMLLNQVLIGHRLFTDLQNENERFVEISEVRLLKDSTAHEIWSQIRVASSALRRLGYANRDLLTVPAMRSAFRLRREEQGTVIYELAQAVQYTHRPSDVVRTVAQEVMPCVWASVLATAPFRRYYLYMAGGVTPILPQLASIYAMFYYLGSLTRYRPSNFRELIDNRSIGPSISEFVENQPLQFLYLMASVLAEQEITRASIVQ